MVMMTMMTEDACVVTQSVQNKQESLLQRLDELDRDNDSLRGQLAELEDTRDQLQQQVTQLTDDRNHLVQQINDRQVRPVLSSITYAII